MAKEKIKETSEIETEEMVSMYDPAIDTYRDIPISCARKLIEEARRLEKQLTKEEK